MGRQHHLTPELHRATTAAHRISSLPHPSARHQAPASPQVHPPGVHLHRQPAPKRRFGLLRTFTSGLWQALVTALAMVGLIATVGFIWFATSGGRLSLPSLRPAAARQSIVRAAESLGIPKPMVAPMAPVQHVIYLNREGGIIAAGPDDSATNRSSVIAGARLSHFEVESFRSSRVRWDAIVSCVEDQFEAYDIEVVDQRPVEGPYIMAMVGGRPGELAERTGHEHNARTRVTGLAPLGQSSIDDAVVFIFSREMRDQTRPVCETIAHEVGHALSLDHVLNRRDPMTHLPRVSRRSFQSDVTACGESDPRVCVDGSPAQSSHQSLLEILGPRRPEVPTDVAGRARATARPGRS